MKKLPAFFLTLGLFNAVLGFEPIVLAAKDFVCATGNPTLQMWRRDGAVVPVWSLSGGQVGQSITATTPALPADCQGVKIEALVLNEETTANDTFTDVFRVDVAELATGTPVTATQGKPVLHRLAPAPWTPRNLTLESFRVVRGGAPLALTLHREPDDRGDTYPRPAGLVQVRLTPLSAATHAAIVENRPGYNSWPMIQSLGDKLICTYSRGSGHSIDEGARHAYARTSTDGGKTWHNEMPLATDPSVGEVMIGKGLDRTGAALFWVRCLGKPRSHHDLYRTTDGLAFEKIAEPRLDPFPMQITDIFPVPQGLMALWFATNYRPEGPHAWGTLTSTDDGRTWQQRTVETVATRDELPTEPSVVNLGGGRLLGLARTEDGGDALASQFQLTSCDNGATWTKTRTNIRDILISSPSLIYDAATGRVVTYYYERGRHIIKRRTADAAFIFDHPFDWPDAEGLMIGDEERPHDAGNVNAVAAANHTHALAYYSGSATNTTVYVHTVRP